MTGSPRSRSTDGSTGHDPITGFLEHGRDRRPARAQRGAWREDEHPADPGPGRCPRRRRRPTSARTRRGITHIGDTPPAGCANVPMYEVTRSGTILRKIEPTPTGDQIKAKQEEEARAEGGRQGRRRAAPQGPGAPRDLQHGKGHRHLPRPEPEADRGAHQERAGAHRRPSTSARRSSRRRWSSTRPARAARPRQGRASRPPSSRPTSSARSTRRSRSRRSIADYEKEMEEVRERYDADKKRWVELKQMHREGKLDLRDPKELEAAKKRDRTSPGSRSTTSTSCPRTSAGRAAGLSPASSSGSRSPARGWPCPARPSSPAPRAR